MIGEALRLIRVFHDLKQVDVANILGVSKSYLSEIENSKKEPSLELLEKYSNSFDLPLSSILFFSESLEGNGKVKEGTRIFVAEKILRILSFLSERSEIFNAKSKRI
jgi:transcriptional regulator with XRE-family HTH domain